MQDRALRLLISQPLSPAGDETAASAEIDRALAVGRATEADIAVLPELMLPGYGVEDMATHAQALDGPWIADLCQRAKQAGCGLILGYAEREGTQLFNSAVAISAAGKVIGHHRKVQLFGAREARLFDEGDSLSSFDLGDLHVGLLICYDVEFAHHVRALALRGVDLVIAPSANYDPLVTDRLLPAQAITNGVMIAYVNFAGTEGTQFYCGESAVVDQRGAFLARAGAAPGMLIVDLPVPELPTAIATHLTDHRDF
ncbi:nitrilase [Frigidibacter sp. RF13]|uniref:nitrilase-related carbon-nitrogen hydrolase n=1 Tax=Frigidibacter sp. RF13 TaxID=2997340 RepID=UPI00226E2811|nr:nitrilase-related carbon-nitrogen hydrolase [Frigidibacter sp. RF13]MCY1127687.1 nitrilase [Frigidibacter sp. RF13]